MIVKNLNKAIPIRHVHGYLRHLLGIFTEMKKNQKIDELRKCESEEMLTGSTTTLGQKLLEHPIEDLNAKDRITTPSQFAIKVPRSLNCANEYLLQYQKSGLEQTLLCMQDLSAFTDEGRIM